MTHTKTLQPLAWTIPTFPENLPPVDVLALPERWRTAILDLGESDRLPAVKGFYHTVRAIAAEILHFAPNAFSGNPDRRPPYWIYASPQVQPLDVHRLTMATQTWILTCYDTSRGRAAAQAIQSDELSWQRLHLTHAHMMGVFPELIARLLLESRFELTLYTSEGQPASWRMRSLPALPGEAELITWPPDLDEEKFPYSYSLRFRIGTLPGSTSPLMLLCYPGLRRWVGWPLVTTGKNGQLYSEIDWKAGKLAYLGRTGTSWLSQQPAENYLLPLRLWRTQSSMHRWAARASEVFVALRVNEVLPDPQLLLQSPRDYPSLVIPHAPTMRIHHRVGSGLESIDHFEIYEQLTGKLSPYHLQPTPVLPKGTTYTRAQHSYTADARKTVPVDVRRQAISSAHLPMRIIICSDDAEHWEDLLREELGLLGKEEQVPDLTIEQNPFTYELARELPQEAMESEQSAAGATLARVREITHAIPSARGSNAGILLEMLNYQEEYHRGSRAARRDPKTAARWGLARVGYKLQCIRPYDSSPDDYNIRIRNGIRDMLRQLDYRQNALYPGYLKSHLPPAGGLDLLGLWVIRTNRRTGAEIPVTLPLIAYAPGNELRMYICLPGVNGPQWVGYDEAPLLIPDHDGQRMTAEHLRNFFVCALRDLTLPRDTLLLIDEQNMRSIFPQIQDEEIEDSDLKKIFALRDTPCRIARLRSSSNRNVPLTYPAHAPGHRTAGVFPHPLHPLLFYSIQEKPATVQYPTGMHQRDPKRKHKPSWNPSTLEILMRHLAPDDVAEEWAWVVHRLRQETHATDNATALPEPLHGLRLLEEYIPRLVDEEESTD